MVSVIGFGISLLLLIYPYLIYPQLLKLLPKHPDPGANPIYTQKYALLFCAYDEAEDLPDTLDDLRALKQLWPSLDIYAFNDQSRDGTGPLLDNASDILTPIHGSHRSGKAAGITQMLTRTQADIVLFMDANTRLDVATVLNFRRYFSDTTIGAVAATVQLPNAEKSATARVGSAFWRLEEQIKALESRSGSTVGCDGALWGIRRYLYPRFAHHISDDFRPSMEPAFKGLRVISAPDIRATEAAGNETGHEFSRKIRIACGAWHAHLDMRQQIAQLSRVQRFKYISHKLLRWFSFFWLTLVGLFSISIAWQLGLISPLIIIGSLGTMAMLRNIRPFGKIAEIVLAMLATQIGIIKAMRGTTQAIWSTVRS